MSKRVAETTTCSASASLGEGVGEGCCARQTSGAKASSAASGIGKRIRLGCWRARLAVANFLSCAVRLHAMPAIGKDCFGATKPTHGRRALLGTNQNGRFCITSFLQLRESDLYARCHRRSQTAATADIAQLSFFFLRRSFFGCSHVPVGRYTSRTARRLQTE